MNIYFVLGSIGAGKTHYIMHTLLPALKKTNYLSPDLIIRDQKLDYYQARERMTTLMSEHVNEKRDFITEGTGQHYELFELFKEYTKDPDIKLHVYYIDIPIEVALKRNNERFRSLESDLVMDIYNKSVKNRALWQQFGCQYLNYLDILTTCKVGDQSCY